MTNPSESFKSVKIQTVARECVITDKQSPLEELKISY